MMHKWWFLIAALIVEAVIVIVALWKFAPPYRDEPSDDE